MFPLTVHRVARAEEICYCWACRYFAARGNLMTLIGSLPVLAAAGRCMLFSSNCATAQACDGNYAGACVPVASDVDCAGGSGNGPEYVRGPVAVVGADVYDLDRDGDGIGCDRGRS
jgi:hypothetical protein